MNLKYHLLVVAAALSLDACSTDDNYTEPENEGCKLSFTVAEDSETRTTLDKGDVLRWLSTDKVGIYTVGQNKNSNIETRPQVGIKPVSFNGFPNQAVFPGDKFYAYYPYNTEQSADPSSVELSIPVEQKQTEAGVYNGETHPLVALPMVFPGSSEAQGSFSYNLDNVRFRQLGVVVELRLYSTYEASRNEEIHSVTFESADNVPLAGDFTFNLTTVPSEPEDKSNLSISGYTSTKVTTSLVKPAAIPATEDEAARIYMTIAPGKYSGKFIVKTNVTQYELELKKSIDFGRAMILGLPANLANAKQIPIEFEDATVRKICVEQWDTNKDDGLSIQEAAAVKSIGTYFKGKSIASFNELQYFTGLQSIKSSAFEGCSSLTEITIPDGVAAIESSAFKGCSSLTSIRIPNGTIGANAFDGCENLTSVNMLEGVTEIGDAAFSNCLNLSSITIPQTVSSIGERVFVGSESLARFDGKYASADHYCLINDEGVLLVVVPAIPGTYTIPDGVTTIGKYALENCFFRKLTISNGVKEIQTHAFYNGSIKYGLYCKPTDPPTLGSSALAEADLGTIYVPAASVEAYKAAEGWSGFTTKIKAE